MLDYERGDFVNEFNFVEGMNDFIETLTFLWFTIETITIDLEGLQFYYEDNEEDQQNNNYIPSELAPKILLMHMKADLQTKIADLKNQLDLLNTVRIEE